VTWTLRPYQVEAIRAVRDAWQTQNRTLLVMATGTGKTTVFAEILKRRRIAGRGRALVLAHRLELIEQAADRIRLGGLDAEVESGDSVASTHEVMGGAPVVVATVQSLKGRRLARWPQDAFGTIIVDEAHHATAAGYRAVLDAFPGAKILGVTATPDRGDRLALGGVIDHLAYEYSLRDGIRDGYLSPIRALAVDTPSVDLSSVRTTKQEHGRDYSAEDLAKTMLGEEPLHEIAGPIARETEGRQTIVFVPSVEIAHELARVLAVYLGSPRLVAALDGSFATKDRKEILGRYRSGEVRVLVNCALFTEGFDAPETSCVAIARPTKSRALYAQMVGRGTRLAPGKADCLVLDLAPSNARHNLVAPVDLLAGKELPEDILAEARAAMSSDDVLQVVARAEERAAKRAEAAERMKATGHLTADVTYKKILRDPFAELSLVGEVGEESGPRATDRQVEVIKAAGLELPKMPSRGEAGRILDELTNRRRKGLCTIKQMRQLASRGLRTDLTFEEAGACMTALATNGWRMTPEIAEKWGSDG
jgi:superfamily II DNA or RNA helicase